MIGEKTDDYVHFVRIMSGLYHRINLQVSWQQLENNMFGRTVKQPRMSANYSLHGNITYTYSGSQHPSKKMPSQLLQLRSRLRDMASTYKLNLGEMNFCVVNKYRDGDDYVGWHADDEGDIDQRYPIVSVSMGGTRRFSIKNKNASKLHNVKDFELRDGDVFVMKPGFQDKYLHTIRKTKKKVGARINVTFRTMNQERVPAFDPGDDINYFGGGDQQ